jgi:hypothetical protein
MKKEFCCMSSNSNPYIDSKTKKLYFVASYIKGIAHEQFTKS